MRFGVLVRHDRDMNTPTAHRVVDALIAARLVDAGARQDAIEVVGGVLDARSSAPGDAPAGAEPTRRGLPQLVEVVAYLGGALVLAAGGLFLFQQWEGLGFGAQVTLLAVVAAVLAFGGGVASRLPADAPPLRDPVNDSRRRLSGTLLSGAALTVAFLVGRVVDEMTGYDYPGIYWPALLGAGAGVLLVAVAYRITPTAVGVVAMLAGVATALVTVAGGVERYEGDAIGVALFLTGVGWLGATELGWFRETTVARTLGVATALVGAQVPVMDGTHAWLGYALTMFVAIVGIAVYLGKVAWPYLAGAVIAVTLVVPESVSDWTDGSLGAIGAVLVAGITLLVASFAGYRVRAEVND